LAPGYKADINVFKDLTTFEPEVVCKDGQILVKDRQLLWESAPVTDIPYGFHASETFVGGVL
jgi:adenine deaminase